jgi:prephenate dehydrogenase
VTAPAVCVLGLGLIGGSLLRAAEAAGRDAFGTTKSTVDSEQATADGFDVLPTVEEALARAAELDALVVVSVPLPAVEEVLRAVNRVAPRCRLTDVVGVKAPMLDAVVRLVPNARYAGGHPMAGLAASGWAVGDGRLFERAAWMVSVDEGVDLEVWADVARLALDIGAFVVPAMADDHDAAVARISHLPHLLAVTLAAVGADGGPLALTLAAGSFRDGTRVAGSRPELVTAMCEGNRVALLTVLDEALGRLGAARGSLASTGSLGVTIRAGREGRRVLEEFEPPELIADLTDPDILAMLRELGRRGGRVTGLVEARSISGPA